MAKIRTLKKILITGAGGLVGTRLTELLLLKGYTVHKLGRKSKLEVSEQQLNTANFFWNLETGELDVNAFKDVSAIIHLAGAGVAEKRWTDNRKQEIIDSRVKSAQLIYNYLKTNKHTVKTFISAAAVGYYGDCGATSLTELQPNGKGFLAEVCKLWEKAATQFSDLEIREVRCRIGIVLAKNGGALPELTRTLPVGVASYFSKDELYYPWIHLDDVCGIMIHALENENMAGAYNTCAPKPIPIKTLMQKIVASKKSNAILIPAPTFAIKLALGEMSEMVLNSQNCSSK